MLQPHRSVNQTGERTVRLVDPAREMDLPSPADTSRHRPGDEQSRIRIVAQPDIVVPIGNAGPHVGIYADAIQNLPRRIDRTQAVQVPQPGMMTGNKRIQCPRVNPAPRKLLLHFFRHREHGQINLVDGVGDLSGEREREVPRDDFGSFLVSAPALPK